MKEKLEVLITSGGTISKIDDVRHVGNFSSGTTGMYIAEEFLKNGDNVHYVYSKGAKRPLRERLELNPSRPFEEEIDRLSKEFARYHQLKDHLNEYKIETFEDYFDMVKTVLERKKIDVVILAAAVSDYSAVRQNGKISSDLERIQVEMVKNPKVIKLIKEWSPNVYQVGFKLLSNVKMEELIETAYNHGRNNRSDLVVANVIYGGFGRRDIVLITPEKEIILVSERALAEKLVEEVKSRIKGKVIR